MNRFTKAGVQRLHLSHGDWIEVRKDLNTGEAKQLEAAGMGIPTRINDGSVYTPIDWAVYEIERAAIFLLDWSFKGDDDKVMPLMDKDGKVLIDVIRSTEPATFEEINKAIMAHVLARAAEKNAEREHPVMKTAESPEPEPVSQ